jgi:hypothetical protein
MSRLFPRGVLSRIELVAGQAIDAQDATLERLQATVRALRGERA